MGSKAKNVPEIETEDTKESFEELLTIFSTAIFTLDAENTDEQARDEDELDLGMHINWLISYNILRVIIKHFEKVIYISFQSAWSFEKSHFVWNFLLKDDIDIDMDTDIPGEKPKEQNMLAALNKEKLASKFMAFKGPYNTYMAWIYQSSLPGQCLTW